MGLDSVRVWNEVKQAAGSVNYLANYYIPVVGGFGKPIIDTPHVYNFRLDYKNQC